MENKYREELIATAKAIGTPGKGILAADESTGTIGKRFSQINLENTLENRRDYRELLFTTPGLGKYISGAILYEETLFQKTASGVPMTDLIKKEGIIIGIKTDLGARPLPYYEGETYTQGLTDLNLRCAKYYEAGARFTKWRAVLRIGQGQPSECSILENAWTLARQAAIAQVNGLCPIVEPEILMDGPHDLATCERITQRVINECYKAMTIQGCILEGSLLKPNMVIQGSDCPVKATPEQVGRATVNALQRSVPASVPGIMFLSGGQTEEEATVNLNAINAPGLEPRPWALSFSFGRALQKSCILSWKGKKENVKEAQTQLLVRAKANSDAQLGKYTGDAANEYATMSNFVANYRY